jgi:DNA (cytosine-5)-methyltransferase 1
MSRPRLLDLFCGAGGCSVGYARAGFEVVGVDIAPQPNYPFRFLQVDALAWLEDVLMCQRTGLKERTGFPVQYDAIHASPPCQAFSAAQSIRGREHPDLLTPTRDLLNATWLPWVIENVPGAPMRKDLILCGSMFGLEYRGFGLRRHRWFEFADPSLAPLVSPCWHRLPPAYVYGHGADNKHRERYGKTSVSDWKHLMGIDWMTRDELSQSIPPAYTELIGAQLLDHLRAKAAA